jgi:glutamate synthase (NADPH/NADH) large chain
MMRKCHLNTCPVGVATQDPELRKRFQGKPEHVINYLFFVAEEVRALMASLGFRTIDEMVGRSDCIVRSRRGTHPRARLIDFSEVLYRPKEASVSPVRCTEAQDHNLSGVLDHGLIDDAREALTHGTRVRLGRRIRNRDRAFGSMLSGVVARRYGDRGLPDDTVQIEATGSAGQSLGAFACRGITIALEGDANDYAGKGLSGGILAVRPPRQSPFRPEEQVIAGNTVLYGATSGKAFFNGRAGERFAVRNSGALAVVEGTGDHGCEYMTGGVVIVLGTTGRNFGAGMSAGVAVVLDEDGGFPARCHADVRHAIWPLSDGDAEGVAALLEEHLLRTQSPKAARLLASWDAVVPKFAKVVPHEYRRALDMREQPAVPATLAEQLALSTAPASAPVQVAPSSSATEKKVVHG